MQTISERVVEFGGAALIADYGYDDNQGNLLKGYCQQVECRLIQGQTSEWIFMRTPCNFEPFAML